MSIELAPTLGHLTPSFGLVLDYANQPLIVRSARTGESGAIVSHRVVAHVLAALGVTDRLQFHLRVPVVFQVGDAPTLSGVSFGAPDPATLADMAVGGAVRLLGDAPEDFHLGLTAEVLIPSMTVASGYASDNQVSFRGAALLDAAMSGLRLELSLGAAYRPERQFESLRTVSELDAQLGMLAPAHPSVDIFFELSFATGLREDMIFQAQGTSLELLLGSRIRMGGGACVDLGIGGGFLRAPGTPAVRALASFRWEPLPPPVDQDGDQILDAVDACPSEPEDVDDWRDGDGCPEPDDDEDRVLDAVDACRAQAEDVDGWQDEDGCPDPDDDGDGVLDADDACPRVSGDGGALGCPITIHVEGAEVTLMRGMHFEEEASALTPADGLMLDELATFMQANQSAARWRVEVRPLAHGRRDDGAALALARAEAIAHSLEARGVDGGAIDVGVAPLDAVDLVQIVTLQGASQ